MQVERWNLLHPTETPRTPRVTSLLAAGAGPVVAVTDFVRAVPDQVARWVPRPYTSLGTDGFGRSDTREALRRFFEIDAAGLVVSVLGELAKNGTIKRKVLARAIADLGIATDDEPPWRR
jgi:pyruvate dehydrogenase E1 component